MIHSNDESSPTPSTDVEASIVSRKPYLKPEITCELHVETRAGSPIAGLVSVINPFDPRPKL